MQPGEAADILIKYIRLSGFLTRFSVALKHHLRVWYSQPPSYGHLTCVNSGYTHTPTKDREKQLFKYCWQFCLLLSGSTGKLTLFMLWSENQRNIPQGIPIMFLASKARFSMNEIEI